MTTAAINTTYSCNPEIVRSLLVIRAAPGPLPAFNRGQMFYDFDVGKVRTNPARPTSSDS